MLAQSAIDGMFFTGSVRTGQSIAQALAGRMIPLQLELGGKDAVYVCDDVPLDSTVAAVADGAFYNTGQSCCSVERIYFHEAIYDQAVAMLVRIVEGFVSGDPREASTYIGPLARGAQIEVLEAQIHDALARGGRVLTGGKRKAGPGYFFEPTVLTDVPHDTRVVQEESFGPIVVVAPVSGDEAAIERMNDSRYGLTAGVYTRSRERARSILTSLDVGTCYWNACDRVSPRLPWSGRRESGMGVTLSTLGIRAFLKPRAWHWVRGSGA
jgi:acyl-CoA reductase-like NAD-dependent aldehyde dehydrogenase